MPVEIRRAIYAHIIHGQTHAFLLQGRLQLSVCLQPSLGDDSHDGRERKPTTEGSPDPTFLDVCDFVSERTAINITDLDTLDVLLQKPFGLSSDLNRPWHFWDYTRPGIRKLGIALRLPLAFYKALQEDENFVSVTNHDTSIESNKCATWARLWPAICQLPQLRSLHIWLDHDDRPSWSFVNERVALRPVIAALTAHMQACSEERTTSHMDITFNLPKLHPRFARPDTHFFEESPPPPFSIERRIRQRFHCEEWASGNLNVAYKADFPVMHEYPELCEESAKQLEGLVDTTLDQAT
ncbi:hypothetical protein V495_00253 [Pseudogymnoascus sp. VKM F-4514 (FW-929)]|nr:hypothetical protein V495_00253 [Pseudogymnoascus sp. VKM F-4514 (FW-929)]KFY67117.1 hypothetical protein V497_00546 [Pseudogymnoascus sp. VKM F-4516 (FW-969)]